MPKQLIKQQHLYYSVFNFNKKSENEIILF